jgi:hypothetical protein
VESVPAPISRADEHELVVNLERWILLRLPFLLRGREVISDELLTGELMRFA